MIIEGNNFGTNPAVNVGGGISVQVASTSAQVLSVNLTIPIGTTGGTQPVTVTSNPNTPNALTSAPMNFFVQIPTTLVRTTWPAGQPTASAPGAQGGQGNLQTIMNGQVVTAGGQPVGSPNVCGVFRDYAYSLVDQRKPAQVIQGAITVTLTEIFSKFTGSGGTTIPSFPPQEVPLVNAPNADFWDVISLAVQAPTPSVPVTTCLTNPSGVLINTTVNQAFSLTIGTGTKPFPLTMVNTITVGNFNGTLQAQATITTP
jgi:hypothetical protein